MTDKKPFEDDQPENDSELLRVLKGDDNPTQTLDLGSIFTQELSSSGSFHIRQDIWATTFGKVLQALPIPVFLIDQTRTIVAANQACARISPTYDRKLGADFSQLLSDSVQAKRCVSVLENVFSTRTPKIIEVALTMDGGAIWGRVTFRSVRILDSRFVLALVEDLTAEKKRLVLSRKSRHAILKVNEELKHALEEKEKLLGDRDALLELLNKEKTRAEDLYGALKEEMERREKADRAIRENESRYRQIVEGANDIIFRTDAGGFFAYVNSVSVRVSGYSENELIGKHYTELVEPRHREAIQRFYGIQFVKRTPNTYHEYPFVAKDGEVIWLGQHVQLLFDGENITGFQAIARDITDRKRVEEALRKSEERLELALRGADLGLWDYNFQTGEAFVSARSAEMVGYTIEEAEPHITWWGKQVHPEDLHRVRKAMNDHVKARTQIYECEHRLRHKSGEYIWVLARGKLVEWDEQGNPERAVGTTLDITGRKRMEEALRESEARFREFAEAMPQLVYEIDARGNIVFVNRAGLALGGYKPEDLEKGLSLERFVAAEDLPRLFENMREVLQGRSTSGTEYTLVTDDGTRVPVAAYSTPIVRGNKVVGFRGVCVDITKQREAEEILRRIREASEGLP